MPMPGGGLPNLGPQYIQIPLVSPKWAVGVLFIIHILLVAWIMGTAWMLVFTGSMPRTSVNERYERFTHYFSERLEQTYSFGATFAVFALTITIPLFPRYWSVIFTAINWPLGVIFAVWLIMTFTVLIYYFSWQRLRPTRRRLHQSIILVYALAETVFIAMITIYTAYQIVPPSTPNVQSALSNTVWLPEAVHRVVGNLSYAGFLIAAWAAWSYYRKRRTGTSVQKAYFHWAAHLGLLWGVGFELAQLPIGTYYVFAIANAGPIGRQTYTKMMLTPGSTSQEWLLQILLLSIMFVLGEIYMWSTIRSIVAERRGRLVLRQLRELAPVAPRTPAAAQQANVALQVEQTTELGERIPDETAAPRRIDRGAELWTRIGLIVTAVAGAMACIPDSVPVVGSMSWKWGMLGIFLVWTIVSMVLYFLVTRRAIWGNMSRLSMWTLMIAGACITALMCTMFVIRYTNPQTAYIEHQIPVPAVRVQSILIPQP
jgi:cytochrome bd ubiquinol oxidase subunit I